MLFTELELVKHSFIVMEKLGCNLNHHMMRNKQNLDLGTIGKMGARLVQILEQVHGIGLVYNDLKLENILVGDSNSSCP